VKRLSNQEQQAGKNLQEWPYSINYEKENEVSADVLVLGGGMAGCHAAINAAKRGAKVVLVEKGAVKEAAKRAAGLITGTLFAGPPVVKLLQSKQRKLHLSKNPGILDTPYISPVWKVMMLFLILRRWGWSSGM
jgi:hypothetical protein